MPPSAPSRRARLLAALAIGVLFYWVTGSLLRASNPAAQGSDFTYPWLAARAVAHGVDPYAAVRGAVTPNDPVLFYPVIAALVALPLAGFTAATAGALFVGIGCALLAFAVTDRGWWRLIMFASAPAYRVCWSVQWSPLLMAAALLVPALGIVWAKPNLALPLIAFQSTRRAVLYAMVGGIALVLVSLALQPAWPVHWIATLRAAPAASQYRIPILTPWGAILGLAALRWRRPEARLLFCMACVPQNGFYYDQFPIFLVPTSRTEMLIASTVSMLVMFVPSFLSLNAGTSADISVRYIPLMVVGAYLPALVFVLRRRNEGPLPTWIERRISNLPGWLRGSAAIAR